MIECVGIQHSKLHPSRCWFEMTTQISTIYRVLSMSSTLYTVSLSRRYYNPHFTGVGTEVWKAEVTHVVSGLQGLSASLQTPGT